MQALAARLLLGTWLPSARLVPEQLNSSYKMPSGLEPWHMEEELRALTLDYSCVLKSLLLASAALAWVQVADGSKVLRVCCGKVPSRPGRGQAVTGPGRGSLEGGRES